MSPHRVNSIWILYECGKCHNVIFEDRKKVVTLANVTTIFGFPILEKTL
jgi:hypothetical protein